MSTLHKINFLTRDCENTFVYSDDVEYEKKENVHLFNLPQIGDFLTIFILLDELNETNHTLLVNCITSLKVQTFSNIEMVVINMDNSKYAEHILTKLAANINLKIIYSQATSISVAMDNAVKNCKSEYVSFMNFSDVIPRVKDIEFVVNTLFERKYDYLTLTVDYYDKDGNCFDYRIEQESLLKSNLNFYYGAYFKTDILKQCKFKDLKSGKLDEDMVVLFKKNHKRGNHVKSKTQMNFLGQIEPLH